ncbi:MAG TPA: alpha/beta fold hydrolase [Myxococcales bacterium LLY-WYZ-16_1]|nr:alpha/beta fold hydrolase [Myxococcales bacterium LLY-WYZ-16_1]
MILHHELRGEGSRRTVLLHGFLGTGRNLGVIPRRWSDADRSFLLADLTGHGRSQPIPAGELSLEGMARDLLETLDRVGWQRVRIIGHSLGGRVGLMLRRLAPDRLAHVDLLDITPGPVTGGDADAVLAALRAAPEQAPDRSTMVRALQDGGLPEPLVEWLSMNLERDGQGVRWRFDRAALERFHFRFRGADLWREVAAAPQQTRALVGGRSEYVPRADRDRLESLGVEVEVVGGAGHFVHAERPDAVVDWLQAAGSRV